MIMVDYKKMVVEESNIAKVFYSLCFVGCVVMTYIIGYLFS